MVSGSSDSTVMIWTCPLDVNRGEVIEGIDNDTFRVKSSTKNNHQSSGSNLKTNESQRALTHRSNNNK